MTETLAAIKVAKCDRIIQLGSDGSSLRGTDTYTVNLKLFTRVDGGGRVLGTGEDVDFVHEDVCLSASALPKGKTSEEEADCTELLFERGREKIRLLREQLEADNRDPDALGIPKPEGCTLAKLAGGSLMNDTCNGARCTAKKIKERLAKHAEEYYGAERWGDMSESDREAKSTCLDLLCWAHLRNLFVGEGAKEEKKLLKETLKVRVLVSAWSRERERENERVPANQWTNACSVRHSLRKRVLRQTLAEADGGDARQGGGRILQQHQAGRVALRGGRPSVPRIRRQREDRHREWRCAGANQW